MATISTRQPSVDIEYDKYGERVRKHFENAYAGRAFYALKLKAGKNPKVVRPHIAYTTWPHMGCHLFSYNGKEYRASSLGSLYAIANELKIDLHPYCG